VYPKVIKKIPGFNPLGLDLLGFEPPMLRSQSRCHDLYGPQRPHLMWIILDWSGTQVTGIESH